MTCVAGAMGSQELTAWPLSDWLKISQVRRHHPDCTKPSSQFCITLTGVIKALYVSALDRPLGKICPVVAQLIMILKDALLVLLLYTGTSD